MRRALVVLALLAVSAGVAAAGVDRSLFLYTRTLTASSGGPIFFEPDEAMLGHSRRALGDVRIVDAHGNAVPWRQGTQTASERRVRMLMAV